MLCGLAIGLAAGVLGRGLVFRDTGSTGSQSSAVDGDLPPDRVTALGRLQPSGGVIPILGPPGDRISSMHLKDNQPIVPGTVLKKDDPIATLTSRVQRENDVAVARVQVKEAKNALAAAVEAGKKKVEAAEAELAQLSTTQESALIALMAQVEYLTAQSAEAAAQVERLEAASKAGAKVAAEDLGKARLAATQARTALAAGSADLGKVTASSTAGATAARARIAAAKAELAEAQARTPVESAQKRLDAAESLLKETILKAPIDGVVLRVAGREGQPTGIGTDPILQMADPRQMVAVAEVYESDVERLLGWLRRGELRAEITSPAMPGGADKPLRGSVRAESDVTRMIARNQVYAVGPREDADRRVVEVTVHLDAESSRTASRYVGLQVTVSLSPAK